MAVMMKYIDAQSKVMPYEKRERERARQIECCLVFFSVWVFTLSPALALTLALTRFGSDWLWLALTMSHALTLTSSDCPTLWLALTMSHALTLTSSDCPTLWLLALTNSALTSLTVSRSGFWLGLTRL